MTEIGDASAADPVAAIQLSTPSPLGNTVDGNFTVNDMGLGLETVLSSIGEFEKLSKSYWVLIDFYDCFRHGAAP